MTRQFPETAEREVGMSEQKSSIDGLIRECAYVEQILGKALGYPWFKDDQKNFPGTTEEDGVCVGDHAPGTIAAEAAARISALESALKEAMGWNWLDDDMPEEVVSRIAEVLAP